MTLPRVGIGVAVCGRENIDKRAAVFMASDVVRVHAAGVEGADVTNSVARHWHALVNKPRG
jgi:activator of 2-hydroxyglutaryl-CoA dehydratase